MKSILLINLFIAFTLASKAQNQLSALPAGRYETTFKSAPGKWDSGDIILLNDGKYKLSISNDVGDYKFSITAQRIFFTSGSLKGVYAQTALNNNVPVIVLPVNENQSLKLSSDVLGYYRQ